jgi:hypothetical protein
MICSVLWTFLGELYLLFVNVNRFINIYNTTKIEYIMKNCYTRFLLLNALLPFKTYNFRIVTVLFLLLFLGGNVWGQVTIPAANTNSGSVNDPFGTYYGYERSAMIYTAAQIGSTGNINAVGFYVNSVSTPGNAVDVRVYMKMRTTNFTATSTYASETSGATLVYGPTTINSTDFVAGSWITLALATTFNYTGGTNNLEVIVETNATGTGTGESSTAKQFRYETQGNNRFYQNWNADNTAPTGNGTRSTSRPNIQLAFAGGCNTPAVTLTPTSGTTADVTWTCSGCTGTYIVEYGAEGFTPGTGATAGTGGTIISSATSPTALTGLSATTTTDVYVRQDCGGTYSSNSAVRKFIPGDVCVNAIDLGTLTSPISSTTVGASSDFSYACNANTDPDLVYYIDVPNNYTLVIGQTANGYDSENYLHYGGACPGTTEVACFDDPDVQNVTWQNTTGSTQRLYWVQDGFSSGNSGTFTLAWTLTAPPSCITPIVTLTPTSGTTADVTWTCSGCTGTYIVEHGAEGFTPGTGATAGTGGTIISSATSPTALTGLSATTTTDVYVRQDCGGTYSSNSAVRKFIPGDVCANAIDLGTLTSPISSTTVGASSDFSYACNANTDPDLVYYIDVPNNYTLVIGQTANGYDSENYLHYGGACPGTTEVACFDDPDVQNVTWQNTTGSTQRLYWVQDGFNSGNSGTFTLEWTLTAPPSCIAPSSLGAGNFVGTSADLTWVCAGCVGTYEIEYGASGFTQGSGTTVTSTSSPKNITGLTVGSQYGFYVRQDCGGGSFSTWSGPFTFRQPGPGDVCGAPIVITSLPYSTTDNTSNYGDDYDIASRPALTGAQVANGTGAADYLTGDDVVYSFTPTTTGCYNINLTNPSDWVGLFLFQGCAPFTSTVAYHTSTSGTSRSLPNLTLTAGVTYYIVISSWTAPQSIAYTLTMESCPTCPKPTVLGANSITTTTGNLTWTSNAPSSLFDLYYGPTPLTAPTVATTPTVNDYNGGSGASITYAASGLTLNTAYQYYVREDCGGGDVSNWSGPFSFTTLALPPANDDCSNAKPLTTCGSQDSMKALNGATQSIAAISCAGFTGTANDDVWYSFIADATTMYITVKSFGGYDAVVDLRSGACNGINIGCADASAADGFEDIVAPSLTIGQTYYIRVYDYGTATLAPGTGFWIQVGPGGCWQGANSSAWSDGGNWSDGVAPNSCASNVTIPAGTPNAPAITTANFTVGNVNIASGVNLTLTGNNLNVCGNWAAGTGSNAVTVGTGRVILQGTGSQTITGNTRFESLTVNSVGGSYTNTGIVEIASRLRPQDGTLTNSGTLHFLSTSATDIATINLTVGNTGTISGNIIADRYVPVSGSNQHYVSSPVNSLPLAQFGASGGSGFVVPTPTCDETVLASGSPYGAVFRYNEANGASCSLAGWEVMGGGNADNSRGYSAYLTGAGAPLSVTGAPNMAASYSLAGLTNTGWTNTTLQGRTQNGGWSLVGNPYLSTVNLDAKVGLDAQAQVWQTSGPYAGTYQAVIMGGGSAFVAPFQGFMVHKTTVGGTASFDIGRTECVNTTSTFYKTGNSNGTLSLRVSGNGYNDITTITFDNQATNKFDTDRDANKLPGRLVQPMIASKVNSDLYSINTLESIATNPDVDVQFIPGTNGNYTITADDLITFDPTVMVYLEDKLTNGAWKDFRVSNSYSFTGNIADAKDRFVLHFTPAAYLEVKDADCDNGGVITLEQEGDVEWTVEVKNVATKAVVAKPQPLSTANTLTLTNIPVGTYDIVFTNRNGYVTTKSITVGGTNALVATYTASTNNPSVNQSIAFSSTVNQAAVMNWSFGDGSTSNVSNPSHVYAIPGTYSVVLKATSNEGCEATFAQIITVADVTGIGNVNGSTKEISAFVNSEKNLNITFVGYKSEVATIQVFNIIGQEILSEKHNTGTKFVHEIDQVEAAYLIVKVTIAGQTTTKKVLITKE